MSLACIEGCSRKEKHRWPKSDMRVCMGKIEFETEMK